MLVHRIGTLYGVAFASVPRRSSLSRVAIVSAALQLADAEGLDAVSIRRVAAALGARPMSLYTHIAAKDDLVDLMADAVVGEVLVDDPPAAWRDALRTMAERSWRTFVAHPWLLAASARRRPLGPNALRHAEQLAAAVAPLDLPPRDAWAILEIVNDYTLGHALRVAHDARDGAVPPFPEIDPEAFPHLVKALGSGAVQPREATFAAGLEAVLDGIERRFVA
jgi:AcrR family transcriptional regulator